MNDEPDEFFQETYEGVIRKLLQWKSEPAVVILNNVFYDTGKTAQDFHNAVGNWYQVPHVSIKDTLYQEMQQGKYTREELTPDGLHPNWWQRRSLHSWKRFEVMWQNRKMS